MAKKDKIIARANSTRLSHIDPKKGTKTVWEEVSKLQRSKSSPTLPKSLTPDALNLYYSSISTDPNYSTPPLKLTATISEVLVEERQVFHILDTLSHTATGPDQLPSWFLRLGAPFFSKPLAHLINLSLLQSTVPSQWKSATIHPIPKIQSPSTPSDLRPISVVPVLSRLTERIVVRYYLTPVLNHLPPPLDLSNQFAYRPSGSTTAALITILQSVTDLLTVHPHVYLISFDYSKAFDSLSHSSLSDKLSKADIPDNIYNWIIDYLSERTHSTSLSGNSSQPIGINASIVQGSVLGPTLFNINSADLSPLSPSNRYFKYADDAYLLVPSSNSASIPMEILHHQTWASSCNLKLNPTKTSEIVFKRPRSPNPPPNPGINRVSSLLILGVLVDDKLQFVEHVRSTITACSRSLFALRTLRSHGLSTQLLQLVFRSSVLSKLTYASPSFVGFLSNSTIDQLQSFIRRAVKFGYYRPSDPDISTIINLSESALFLSITTNPSHVLAPLLPPLKSSVYNLRNSTRSRTLPRKDDRNFMYRMLYRNIY